MQESLDLGVLDESVSSSLSRPRNAHVRQAQVFRQEAAQVLVPTDVRLELGEDDPAVWIKEGLKRLDLSRVRDLYGDCGGVPYDPRPMLGILLLAYFEGDTGSRTIAKRCRRDLGYRYVGGGLRPDDSTIRRFRTRIAPALEEVFVQVVRACKEAGLLSGRRLAFDGTKLASAASQMGKWLTKAQAADVKEMGLEPPGPSDPDARNLGSSGGFVLGYNAQAAVDCDSGVTVAVGLDNVSSDGHWLSPLLERAVENAGSAPDEAVADAGYDTNESARALERHGVTGFIAPQSPVHSFWTVTEGGEILCPMGEAAVHCGVQTSGARAVQVLKVTNCGPCIFFKECCGASGYRGLSVPVGCDPAARLQASSRTRGPDGRLAMRERLSCIEPVFGDVKWNKGLGRLKLRGLAGARLEWLLIHLARNLTKFGRRCLRRFRRIFTLRRPLVPSLCPKPLLSV